MARATAAEIIGLSAKHAWAQASTEWPSPEEAKSIAQETNVYAFPIAQNYLSIYQLALDPNGSQYKGHRMKSITWPASSRLPTRPSLLLTPTLPIRISSWI